MRIIIDIETDKTENTNKIKEKMNHNLEETMFGIIKEDVERIIERSRFTSNYFKNCKITIEQH